MFEASVVMGWVAQQEPNSRPAAADRLFNFVVGGTVFFLLWWGMTFVTRRLGCQIPVSCVGAVLVVTLVMIVAPSPGLDPPTPHPRSTQLPAGCAQAHVADLVTDFLDAFNRGDQAALAAFFPAGAAEPGVAEPGTFRWFHAPVPGGRFMTDHRDELLAWFAVRHERHERLELLRLEVTPGWHPEVYVRYDIARQADDLPAHVAGGSGSVLCAERTIFVWSMGETAVWGEGKASATPEVG